MKENENKNIRYLYENKKKDLDYYLEYLLANDCMPTLLNIKPSNLICISKNKINECISQCNYEQKLFNTLGYKLRFFEKNFMLLYENEVRFLLLIYNKELISKLLYQRENLKFFDCYEYDLHSYSIENVLRVLKQRYLSYQTSNEFPHEIGILLGYPACDVEDFIKYRGKNYKLCGYWKVYHNVERANCIFDVYNQLRRLALSAVLSGIKLEDIKFDDIASEPFKSVYKI